MGSWHIDVIPPGSVVLHTIEGTLSDAQLDEYVRAGTATFLDANKHVTVMDIRRMNRASASAHARSRTVAWFRAYRPQIEAQCLGVAYVLDSPLLRFMLMTVLLMVDPPVPCRIFQTPEEALEWAQTLID